MSSELFDFIFKDSYVLQESVRMKLCLTVRSGQNKSKRHKIKFQTTGSGSEDVLRENSVKVVKNLLQDLYIYINIIFWSRFVIVNFWFISI